MASTNKSFSFEKMLKLEHQKTAIHYNGIYATSQEANRIRAENTKTHKTGFKKFLPINIE